MGYDTHTQYMHIRAPENWLIKNSIGLKCTIITKVNKRAQSEKNGAQSMRSVGTSGQKKIYYKNCIIFLAFQQKMKNKKK